MEREINSLDDFTEKELLKLIFTNMINLKMQVNKIMEMNKFTLEKSIIDDEIVSMLQRRKDMEKIFNTVINS